MVCAGSATTRSNPSARPPRGTDSALTATAPGRRRSDRPHLIVSDLSLPGADGLQFIRALRRLEPEAGGDVPAIAVSGYDKDFTAIEARKAGYTGYLAKPVNLDDLVTLVRDLVNP